jgi:hypothetical protein
MKWDDIQRELLFVVRNWPTEILFTKDSSTDLARQIVDGVSQMVAQDRTSDDDVAMARDSVRRLLEEMELERDRLGLHVFTESTLAGALGRLCPGFFPFC